VLVDRCYRSRRLVGYALASRAHPVNGVELAKVPVMNTAETTKRGSKSERASPSPAWPSHRKAALHNILSLWFDLIAAIARTRADPDLRSWQAAQRSARRDRSSAPMSRSLPMRPRPAVYGTANHSDASPGFAAAGDPAADRFCGGDHAVEFPVFMITRRCRRRRGRLHRGCRKPVQRKRPLTALALFRAVLRSRLCRRACSISSPAIRHRSQGPVRHPAVRFVGLPARPRSARSL